MKSKTPTTEAAPSEALAEPITTTEPAPTPKKAKARKKGPAPELRTIELAAGGYLGSLEARGSSKGTVASYAAELKLAGSVLGDATDLRELTVERVVEYFNSPRVTTLRSGREKSPLSVAKSRRVFRQLVLWSLDQGWIEVAPLPEKDDVAPPPAPAKSARPKRTPVAANASTPETAA